MSTVELGIGYLVDAQPLGRGGFSTVYAATDTRFDRQVAVKVLTPLGDDSLRRKFDRECRVMGRLSSHPNVVTVFDSGFDPDGSPFLVMELVSGGSLADRLDRTGPVPWREAVDMVLPVADALGHAHDANVLHRDVKPENILVSEHTLKLTDFGISSFRDGSGATSVSIAASWHHAPPETLDNKRDARSDLYSLASTLYTLISGKPPLWRAGDGAMEALLYRVLHEPAPALGAGLVPPALDLFLQRALAKDPNHRPQTAAMFAAELRAAATADPSGVDPVVGPVVGPAGRGQPGRVVAASVAFGIVLVIVGYLGVRALLDNGGPGDQAGPRQSSTTATTSDQVAVGPVGTANADVTSTGPAGSAAAAGSSTSSSVPSSALSSGSGPELASYQARTITPLSPGVTEFVDFLAAHKNEIVELDVVVTVADLQADWFTEDGPEGPRSYLSLYDECYNPLGPGEVANSLDCSGYSLQFLKESAGTSLVGWQQAEQVRIFGYFSVGALYGPNQGIFSLQLDPISPADVTATN